MKAPGRALDPAPPEPPATPTGSPYGDYVREKLLAEDIDCPGRYADCYEDFNQATKDLLEDLADKRITPEQFTELWEIAEQDLYAFCESVDFDAGEYLAAPKITKNSLGMT